MTPKPAPTFFLAIAGVDFSSLPRQFISKEMEYLFGIFHLENLRHKN